MGGIELGSGAAIGVSFDPSGLTVVTGLNVQEAIEQLDAEIAAGGGGGGGGEVTLISDQTLGADAATIDFSGIPATFAELRLVFQGRSARAGQAADTLGLRVNNDATANYRTPHIRGNGAAASSGVDAASALMPICEIPGATGTANTPGQAEISIPNYAGITFHKTALLRGGDTNGSFEEARLSYGRWTSTAAINRLTLLSVNGANLLAGSRAILYGIGGDPSVRLGQLLHVLDEKASGTHGGDFNSGAWRTRTLNTVKTNEITGASLAANEITLPAGTYEIDASAPGFVVNGHQARLFNVTGAAVLLVGTSEIGSTTDNGQTRSEVRGRFTLAATSAVRLEHQCGTTAATFGFGRAAGFGTEVFAEVQIRKVG